MAERQPADAGMDGLVRMLDELIDRYAADGFIDGCTESAGSLGRTPAIPAWRIPGSTDDVKRPVP